jgi:hypothetical protein
MRAALLVFCYAVAVAFLLPLPHARTWPGATICCSR